MTQARVLFVEDDPEMSSVYQENFMQPEFETVVATNGKDALEKLRTAAEGFDVVVTDNFMPEMDGITMLKTIRREFPGLIVFVVTGYGNWADYVEAHNLGVTRFLDKPIKMAALRDLIRAECAKR